MIKKLLTVVVHLCTTTISLNAQDFNPDWYKKGNNYFKAVFKNTEGNFTMDVIGTIDGERCDSAYEIGVFCGDECRLSMPYSSTAIMYEYFGFYSALTINGVSGENFSFRLYDHRNNVEVGALARPNELPYVADKHYGSFNNGLYDLAFSGSTTHRAVLEIDDATDLPFSGTQYSITADGIECSYTRNAYLDGGYETIVLPFDADISAIKEAGFVFEKFEGFGENTIKFVELAEDENLQAGVPYLFRYSTPSAGRQEIEFVADMSKVEDKIVEMQGWTGTFKRMKGNEIAGKYILNTSGNKMVKAGTGAGLNPYHAYLNLPEDVDAPALTVSHRSATTDADEVLQENVHSEEIMFDLSGRRVKHPSAGDVIIKNNKKMYIR